MRALSNSPPVLVLPAGMAQLMEPSSKKGRLTCAMGICPDGTIVPSVMLPAAPSMVSRMLVLGVDPASTASFICT